MINTYIYNSAEHVAAAQAGAYCVLLGSTVTAYTGEDIPVKPIMVPLTSRQFWLALEDMGLTDAVEAAVSAMPRRAQIEVRAATEIDRQNALVIGFAAALKKSSAEVDALFLYGASL